MATEPTRCPLIRVVAAYFSLYIVLGALYWWVGDLVVASLVTLVYAVGITVTLTWVYRD